MTGLAISIEHQIEYPVSWSGPEMNPCVKVEFSLRPFGSFTFTVTEAPKSERSTPILKAAPYVFPSGTVLPTQSDGVDFI